MTTNLKERFEERFKTALLGLIRGIYCVSHNAPASSSEILTFIKQELELLADEIEEKRDTRTIPEELVASNALKHGFNIALKLSSNIIRNRANEI